MQLRSKNTGSVPTFTNNSSDNEKGADASLRVRLKDKVLLILFMKRVFACSEVEKEFLDRLCVPHFQKRDIVRMKRYAD